MATERMDYGSFEAAMIEEQDLGDRSSQKNPGEAQDADGGSGPQEGYCMWAISSAPCKIE
jgi:hypothetical protein